MMRVCLRRAGLAACALLTLVLPAAGQAAEPDANAEDARCLILSMQLMLAAGDDSVKTAAMLANMYYLGRLDGRAPGLELETRLTEEVSRMTPETANYEAMRCGTMISARSQAISEIGGNLIGRAAQTR